MKDFFSWVPSTTGWKPPPEWDKYLEKFRDLSPTHLSFATKPTKYCVMIEPRRHPYLERVVKNFLSLLSCENWGFLLVHGTENEMWIKDMWRDFPMIQFASLGVANLTPEEYNDFLCRPSWWNYLLQHWNCQYCLLFQCDTVLLQGGLDRFLQYDYVGAPWKNYSIATIGNGGLSIRNVATMLKICQTCPRYNTGLNLANEDIYFAYYLKKRGDFLPTVRQASEFSVETVYFDRPCGLHQPHFDNFPRHWRTSWFP
jgi:hypothetical protein